MKKLIITTFLFFALFLPNLYAEWKSYDSSAGDGFNFKFDDVTVTVKPGNHSMSSFKEDNLMMIIDKGHSISVKQDFVSSYSAGKILFKSGFLFLEYGIGRGTSARTEHIKVFSLSSTDLATDELIEICDVQKSYYFSSPIPNTIIPWKVEYEVKIIEEKKDVHMIFDVKQKSFEIPERKEIILKKIKKHSE